MGTIILYTVLTLSGIGAVSALILFFVAQRFKIYEDPRIDTVAGILPGANCGGCGFAGCRNLAEAIVKAENMDGLYCPVGRDEVMNKIAAVLGRTAGEHAPMVAVVRCNGTPENRQRTNRYDGAQHCAIAHALYTGEGGCPHGCLGYGDCVAACKFDAIHIDKDTGLPVVDEEKCTACGACVKACPRKIIELRKKAPKGRKIYVSCVNEEKGAICIKNCKVACIGCGKCVKVCAFEAITLNNNLAYIDSTKCRLCRKCVNECPTHAILEFNFPPQKEKVAVNKTAEESNSIN